MGIEDSNKKYNKESTNSSPLYPLPISLWEYRESMINKFWWGNKWNERKIYSIKGETDKLNVDI